MWYNTTPLKRKCSAAAFTCLHGPTESHQEARRVVEGEVQIQDVVLPDVR